MKRKIKVKLINPPEISENFSKEGMVRIPYGLGIIASYLKMHGVDADLRDLNALINSAYSDIELTPLLHGVFEGGQFDGKNVCEKGISDERNNSIASNLVKLVDLSGFDAVGIGVTTAQQFYSTLLLAEKIKSEYRIPVIIGGTYVTLFIPTFFYKYAFIDFAVEGEGEVPLLKLIQALEGNVSFEDIPSVWRRDGKKVIRNKRVILNIENQDCPDYGSLNFKLYDEYNDGKMLLPYATSRGCLNKCRFCTYRKIDGRWQVKSVDKIINDLKYLKTKYGVKRFLFTDSAVNLSYEHIDKLCDQLNMMQESIEWSAFVYGNNLDKKLILKMKNSGCCSLMWGIESASQSILEDMRKNVDVEYNEQMIKFSSSIGIRNKIFLIIDYPHESINDLQKTLSFIIKNRKNGIVFLIKRLAVFWGSDIYYNADALGIRLKETAFPNIFNHEDRKIDQRQKKILQKFRKQILRYDSTDKLLSNRLKILK